MLAPRYAGNNLSDRRTAHTVLASQPDPSHLAGDILSADCSHDLQRQFGVRVLSPALQPVTMYHSAIRTPPCSAALHRHVAGVVGRCPGKQMARVHAGWIVAAVTDERSLWNRSMDQLVGDSVRGESPIVDTYRSVSPSMAAASPDPTSIGAVLVHTLPEACEGLAPLGAANAPPAAIPSPAALHLTDRDRECTGTVFTCALRRALPGVFRNEIERSHTS